MSESGTVSRDTWIPADEAKRIGISLRRLRDIMKANPDLPVMRNGNRVLFDAVAHEALKEVLRHRPREGLSTPSIRSPTVNVGPSAAWTFQKAMRLTKNGATKKLGKKPVKNKPA